MSRTLISIDIESTGTNPATDRIIQLGIVSAECDTTSEWVVNPFVHISDESASTHGFTNEMVRDQPLFSEVARDIHNAIKDCDLLGFNLSNFDVPLLWEEFYRAGIEWDLSNTSILDAGTLFKRREQRTLSAACKFYLGKELDGAHNAVNDSIATLEVWNEQIRQYGLTEMNREELERESNYEEKRVDLAGKIIIGPDGRPVYNFGKAKGVAVADDPGFGNWILRNDFTQNTKMHVERILYPVSVASIDDGIPF